LALSESEERTDDGGRQHGGRLAEGGHVTDAVQAHVQHRQLLVLEYTMVEEEEVRVRVELDGLGVGLYWGMWHLWCGHNPEGPPHQTRYKSMRAILNHGY
jgi:hypothetical protein